MRYRVLVDANGKLLRRPEGYYVAASDGSSGIMSKAWVLEHIDDFSNINASNKTIYLVKDKFELSKKVIRQYIISDLNSYDGLDVISDAGLYGFKQSLIDDTGRCGSRVGYIKRNAIREISKYCTAISVYKQCLRDAIQQSYGTSNTTPWFIVTRGGSSAQTRFFASEDKATKYAENVSGNIYKLVEACLVIDAINQLGLAL